ncbi:Heat shock cognate 70 kDa protein 2 [Taenia solium]|eukprot:TsM_001064600 transcript=TsM_001064600 gene=TsM_001064600
MTTRNKLESYIFTIQSKIKDDEIRQKTSEEQRKSTLEMCASMLKWVDIDQVATREVYEKVLKKVERLCSPIMAAKNDGS